MNNTMNTEENTQNTEATYCPEDNKLRLYCGRVDREEYLRLKAEGWTSTPKQDCDFASTWTVQRENTALSYGGGFVGDEDQSPADRAADRAERFQGYQEKRLGEAIGKADQYDSINPLHGHQNAEKAERAAKRHDRMADKACEQWRKAEYWQSRTAGVIANALYKDRPGVRMGRIKKLETELRKAEKGQSEYKARFEGWQEVLKIENAEEAFKKAYALANSVGLDRGYKHPRPENATSYMNENGTSMYSLLTYEPDPLTGLEAAEIWLKGRKDPTDPERASNRYIEHLKMRLIYENAMLEGQGGRLEQLDLVPGGKIGSKLIVKVHKSPATKRVTSVTLLAPAVKSGNTWHDKHNIKGTDYSHLKISTERFSQDAYTEPTEESLNELKEYKAMIKASNKLKPKAPSLINPTLEEALKLQRLWNAHGLEAWNKSSWKSSEPPAYLNQKVLKMTQKQYSAYSKGSYAQCETRKINEHFKIAGGYNDKSEVLFKVRVTYGSSEGTGHATFMPWRVIVISDKPQKAFPVEIPTQGEATQKELAI